MWNYPGKSAGPLNMQVGEPGQAAGWALGFSLPCVAVAIPGRLAEASSPTETPGFRCHLPSPLSYAPMPPGLDPECPLLSLPPRPVPLASPTESTPLVRVPRQRPLGTALTTRCVPLRELRMTSAPLGSLGLAGTSFNLDPATHGVFTMSVTKSHQKWVPATGE